MKNTRGAMRISWPWAVPTALERSWRPSPVCWRAERSKKSCGCAPPGKIREANPDLVAEIEASGARVFCDTCMVVSPATEGFRKMMVNSGKALVYLPGLGGVQAGLGSLEECIDVATGRR